MKTLCAALAAVMLVAGAALADTAPYAGWQERPIKALSAP